MTPINCIYNGDNDSIETSNFNNSDGCVYFKLLERPITHQTYMNRIFENGKYLINVPFYRGNLNETTDTGLTFTQDLGFCNLRLWQEEDEPTEFSFVKYNGYEFNVPYKNNKTILIYKWLDDNFIYKISYDNLTKKWHQGFEKILHPSALRPLFPRELKQLKIPKQSGFILG